jgi:hypothetical protein
MSSKLPTPDPIENLPSNEELLVLAAETGRSFTPPAAIKFIQEQPNDE